MPDPFYTYLAVAVSLCVIVLFIKGLKPQWLPSAHPTDLSPGADMVAIAAAMLCPLSLIMAVLIFIEWAVWQVCQVFRAKLSLR